MSKFLELKKEAKKNSLLHAAQELFLEKGVAKTSISEITQRANVAKGTFYLYFADKEALYRSVIYQTSHDIIAQAYDYAEQHSTDNFTENVILFADWIITYFTSHADILRMVKHGFTWPILAQNLLEESSDDPLWRNLADRLQNTSLAEGHSSREQFNMFYIVVEMCGTACYSSIVEQRPDTIENMKPILYSMIRKVLS